MCSFPGKARPPNENVPRPAARGPGGWAQGLNVTLPRHARPSPTTSRCDLLWGQNRGFAGSVKGLERRASWIRVALNEDDKCPYRKRRGRSDTRGKDHGSPGATMSFKRQEGPSPGASWGAQPHLHCDCGLWLQDGGKQVSVVLGPQACGHLSQTPR